MVCSQCVEFFSVVDYAVFLFQMSKILGRTNMDPYSPLYLLKSESLSGLGI